MSLLTSKSLKFACHHCDKIYLQHYQDQQHRYPHCPDCQQAGLLLGVAEAGDLLRHPFEFASSYIKQTWHKLGKSH